MDNITTIVQRTEEKSKIGSSRLQELLLWVLLSTLRYLALLRDWWLISLMMLWRLAFRGNHTSEYGHTFIGSILISDFVSISNISPCYQILSGYDE